ncbi:MAG TPA: hypothetical protein VLB27_10510, partial [candidate division Zixibacteria bacterium]|nr:hypothetical protein [candidate division Zixibacteria bacterium]
MIFLGPVFEPLLEMFFKYQDYDILRQAMERRQNVENVIQMIERYDAYAAAYDRKVKKLIKEQKKQWKWYQRWLGVNQPKIEPPAELKDFDWRAAGQKENREVFLKSANSNDQRDSAS